MDEGCCARLTLSEREPARSHHDARARCYDAPMRTTVNISDHILAEVRVIAARTHRSLGAVVDDALVAMLSSRPLEGPLQRTSIPTFGGSGLRAGVDLEDRDALAGLLGDERAPVADS